MMDLDGQADNADDTGMRNLFQGPAVVALANGGFALLSGSLPASTAQLTARSTVVTAS